ncbi:MAG: WG repeat-containing protein [Muribaculaceae bacterium]
MTLTPKEQNGLWGYVDDKDKWKIKPAFNYAGEFNDGLACVMNYYDNYSSIVKLYGYINEKGKYVIPQKYNYGSDFKNGIAVVGILRGVTSIRKSRTSIDGLKNKLAEMLIINTNGEPFEFSDPPNYIDISIPDSIRIYKFNDGRLFSESLSKFSVVNTSADKCLESEKVGQNAVTPFPGEQLDYSWVIPSLIEINSIETSGFRWGKDMSIIDERANKVLPRIKYRNVNPVHNVAVHPSDTLGMWGFKNAKGNWVIPAKYDYVEIYSHTYNDSTGNCKSTVENFKVHGYKGWGVVDSVGNIVLEPQFQDVEFYNNYSYSPTSKRYYIKPDVYIGVMKDSLCGVTDYRGQYIIFPQYESIERLTPEVHNDSIPFYKTNRNGKMGLLNTTFKELIPPVIDGYSLQYNRKYNIVRYKSNGRDFICDTLGNHIFSAGQIRELREPDRFVFRNDNGWGLANRKGEVLVPDTCSGIDESYGSYFILHIKNVGDRVINRDGKDILPLSVYKVTQFFEREIIEVQSKEDSPLLEYYNVSGEQLCYNDGSPIIGIKSTSPGRYYIGEYKSIITPNGYIFIHQSNGKVFDNKTYYQILSCQSDDSITTALYYNNYGETMMDLINYRTGEIIYSGYYDGRK